jgi:hypothetical protein
MVLRVDTSQMEKAAYIYGGKPWNRNSGEEIIDLQFAG